MTDSNLTKKQLPNGAVFYHFSSLFLYGQLSPQLEQSPPHDVIGLPFFLAIMIAHIAPTTATTTQTMMIIVAVFIGYFSLRSVNLRFTQ